MNNNTEYEIQVEETIADEVTDQKPIQVTVDVCEAVNFAMQQNHVPIVRRIVITNNTESDIKNIKVSVSSDPDIADYWDINVPIILAGQEYKLDKVSLQLSATRLFELTERINGSITIQVSGEEIQLQEKYNIAFLSYDEWSGANTYPEFLAAFVTPNHPYIFEILKKSESLLTEWTGSPSFTGYQSNNHNNVLKQMAAIYGALQQENITYCAPPASFEKDGQKIRLCSTIKEQKFGTCLDTSLLYASCLEAVGLNPMIVVIKGHAFVACWLENESFAECIQDDISVLTKRIAPGVNEICVVESTAFTKGKSENFESAVVMAENHLSNEDDFHYIVGIKRSRGSGIRPLPLKKEDGSWDYGDGANVKSAVTDKPDEIEVLGKLQHTDSIEYTRQQMWERKLLDLSMRNALLNFRVTKNSLQLLVDSLPELECALVDGKEFQIFHRPNDMVNSPRDNKIYEAINKESPWVTLIKSEFKYNRIRTFLDEATLGKQIQTLYRTAKTNMEENGANTMYLALGFLKWYETNISEKPRYAPLVLLPIDIIRKSAQRGYVFRLRDEEPQFNVTLLEMLRRDFGIAATGLDPLPYDENGVDVKRIFHVIRQLIMNRPRWDVEELAFIGVFSFTQFIMWNDIRHRVDDLRKNKIVSSLMQGQMNWTADARFPLPNELDDNISPADMAVPISADSSQLAAIYTSGKAQSFVLHGPPGTGKSQTITNIIANALYQGKSVLFVAEKMAALEVVEKRLEAIGIGDFCLELHSNKARKKDVLEQLEKALNIGKIKAPDAFYEEASDIFELRKELNEVVRELHMVREFGFSLYDAVSKVNQHYNAPECFDFPVGWINSLTSQKISRTIDLCRLLAIAAKECNGVHNHSLKEYANAQYSHTIKNELYTNLKNYKNTLTELKTTAASQYTDLEIHINKLQEQQNTLVALSNDVITNAPQISTSLLKHEKMLAYAKKINDVCHQFNTASDACDALYDLTSGEHAKIKNVLCEGSVIDADLCKYSAALATIISIIRETRELTHEGKIKLHEHQQQVNELCSILSTAPQIPDSLLAQKDLSLYSEKINAVCKAGKRRDELRIELTALFAEHLLSLDAETIYLQWEQAEASWAIPKLFEQSKITKSIRLYAHNKKAFKKNDVAKTLKAVVEFQKCDSFIAENGMLFNDLFGVLFDGGKCDWEHLIKITSIAIDMLRIIEQSVFYGSEFSGAATQMLEVLTNNIDVNKDAQKVDWTIVSNTLEALTNLETSLSNSFASPLGKWRHEENGLSEIIGKTERWLANLDGLRDYSAYLQVKSDAENEGIGFVCDALERGLLPESEIESAYIKGVSKLCVYSIVDTTPSLSQFRGNLFAHKIEKFNALCKQYQALTRQELAARLSSQVPAVSAGVSGSSEVGILQRAIKSGGRMMPVRKLFESIPTLLRKLSPCMLMSPISVAQYLDPTFPPFDLVVFDEASQMPTNEAVGAIARGSELVVVGDPKQLPPTSFFSSNHIDEAHYDKEDLESILDDCLAISMPQEHLLWHYRSRHESLIAFSNQMYYDNKLFTFPSPNDMVSQVKLVQIDGFYDKGKTKHNRAEAEAIVKEIIRRLSDPVLQKRSMGVVTFNSIQQTLIADMLEEEFAKNPELDEVANNAEEPIFIKNLENVQGDERDVILFSIGYGPDAQGRVALNFGPLNREGGWRRLNVAVSRARYEMLVFSVLRPEQIDLNRTRAEGLVGLKKFLEFAAKGSTEITNIAETTNDLDNIILAIADGIRSLGFDVRTSIGVSGYHVDIGVVHPNKADEYILGVLCDSMNYYKGGTALDRNHTQESVLRHLGWRTTRVWTLDWWESPTKELERIKEEIEDALSTYEHPAIIVDKPKTTNNFEIEQVIVELKKYTVAEVPPANFYGENVEAFLGYSSSAYIMSQIESIMNTEAPISRDVLCKRILDSWGISRRGSRINERFDRLFANMGLTKTACGDAVFYWGDGIAPSIYDEFRVPSADTKTRRNIEHIAPEEIASAAKHIMKMNAGMNVDDLAREVARIFGFARYTENMIAPIRLGIDVANKRNWLLLGNDGRVLEQLNQAVKKETRKMNTIPMTIAQTLFSSDTTIKEGTTYHIYRKRADEIKDDVGTWDNAAIDDILHDENHKIDMNLMPHHLFFANAETDTQALKLRVSMLDNSTKGLVETVNSTTDIGDFFIAHALLVICLEEKVKISKLLPNIYNGPPENDLTNLMNVKVVNINDFLDRAISNTIMKTLKIDDCTEKKFIFDALYKDIMEWRNDMYQENVEHLKLSISNLK